MCNRFICLKMKMPQKLIWEGFPLCTACWPPEKHLEQTFFLLMYVSYKVDYDLYKNVNFFSFLI